MCDLVKMGETQTHWNVSGSRILKYSIEIYHEGLKEHKLISAPECDMLENKVNLQIQKWVEKWYNLERKRKIAEKKEANKEEAKIRTEEAEKKLEDIDNLLIHTLDIDDTVDWDMLKKRDEFPETRPNRKYLSRPRRYSKEYTPNFTFLEKIFKSKKERKIQEYEKKYSAAIADWEKEKEEVAKWEERKRLYYKEQENFNRKIDALKASYFEKEPNSVTEYCEIVLDNSKYPDEFPKNFELEYNPETRILIIEYQLPSIDVFPTVKEVKFIASRNELKEYHISQTQLNKMFDSSLYKITLRTIHEIFEADAADAVDAVSFNGWVESVNKATGKEENNCILSIQVKKEEFSTIDLAKIDPKICFKSLKGVSGSKLSSLSPIQPILQLTKTDKRFVEGYEVANSIDERMNLAAMDWGDFEHLVRELFEKEFKAGGGEVKVTQSSRDGGVDAIAFDPDPIRGGKIVIQAKRYTNTVGVSAVRDLYGTVVNEGAIKGILVTTADYGADAYQFAKDKPITLLNGSNLLHLLEKHGHHAKIDLREAKRILIDQKNEE